MVKPVNSAAAVTWASRESVAERSGENVRFTLGGQDTVRDAVGRLEPHLDGDLPSGWETMFAVYACGELGRTLEPGDTLMFPAESERVFSAAGAVPAELSKRAMEQVDSGQTLSFSRRLRQQEMRQTRRLKLK
ncbi:MAG: hypothetical protein AAFU77_11920 [Myxococcota bacterium]